MTHGVYTNFPILSQRVFVSIGVRRDDAHYFEGYGKFYNICAAHRQAHVLS